MKRVCFISLMFVLILTGTSLLAKKSGTQASPKPQKTTSNIESKSANPREDFESWLPSPNCDSKYYEVLPEGNPGSRCRDIANIPSHGKKVIHYYTCRFNNSYPPAEACSGARMTRTGLESYSCEADNSITRSRNPCIGNYTTISEWHGDIDKDLVKAYPYGFICRAEAVSPVCLAPKYEFVYRSGDDYCCVLYKNEKKREVAEDY